MTIFRYDMSIPVRVVSALHSGGIDEVPERPITDEDGRTVQPNAFVRNGLGEAILPGRSIKGAIRAAFEEHMNELDFSKEELKSLWGGEMRQEVGTRKKQGGDESDESRPLRASALTFHHAVVWDRTKGDLPHRMSTAIDRATGGAADGALFAYEYLPVDTTFEIRVSAEAREKKQEPRNEGETQAPAPTSDATAGSSPTDSKLVEKALKEIVTLIDSELISLGGRTGAGWGKITLCRKKVAYKKVTILEEGPRHKESTDCLSAVLGKPETLKLEADKKVTWNPTATSIEVEWQAPAGLFVGMNKPKGTDSLEKDTVPAAPMRNWHLNDAHRADHGDATYPKVAHEDKASLLLPGTSIRGALRSHCSRIARSIVNDSEGCDALGMPGDVHKQLAADPLLVRYVFGTTEYRGAVRVHDCEGRISEEEPLKLTRNAIDRVTGSAAHGALYSELLYPHATWNPIKIEIDHAQLCRNIRQDPGGFALPAPSPSDKDYELPGFKIHLRAAILLLTMAVTDLCKGILPLGGGTGGGLGFIEVSCVRVNGLPDDTSPVEILFEAADHPEDSCKVRDARANFARDVLTSILTAFAEDGDEATSAEQRVINLIREWAEFGPHDDQGSSVPSHFRPTTVRIGWNSPTGVFVHDPQADKGNTQHPLRVKTASENTEDSKEPLLIPGTSIRGALRSRCSRIARTVLYADNPPSQGESFTQTDSNGNQVPIDIHEQLAKEPRLVRYLFGTTEYRGAVRVRDCTTKNTGPSIKVTHNAIDRWTGGVVEGLLFNEVTYPHATWNDIVIEVDTARLLQNVKTDSGIGGLSLDECIPFARASWCLLCIALAELSAGTLPLGGRTTRGHGQIQVNRIEILNADGHVVNTPIGPILWEHADANTDDVRGGAITLLAYLRDEPEKQNAYDGWSKCLQRLEEPTYQASTPNESDKQ